MLLKPLQQDQALVNDILASSHLSSGCRIWWLGQSGFLIQYNGKHLLFDPYLSDSLTVKYATTDKPHTRLSERCVDPTLLSMIDVVTSSHNHTDHLDAETLWPIFAHNNNLKMVIPEANRAFVAQRLNCPINWPIGLTDGQSTDVEDFTFYGLPAAHNAIERNATGQCLYMGYVVRFGPYVVYHSGDTLWYDGLEDILSKFEIDVAFLPINGNLPERRVAGNLNAEEAARLGKKINAKLVVPHHYDMFAFNTAAPATFKHYAQQYETPHYIMKIGEKISV